MAPGDDLVKQNLVPLCLVAAGAAQRLRQQPGNEIELDRKARAALEHGPEDEAGPHEEVQHAGGIAIDEDVLPRDKNLVQNEDRIVLIEARRQRIVERRTVAPGRTLVRRATQQLQS